MSYDLHVEYDDWHGPTLEHSNMTWNINRLLGATRWVGLKLRDLDYMPVGDAAKVLLEVLVDWTNDWDYYETLQVPHWGSLNDCWTWVNGLRKELNQYNADAILRVS